MHILDLELRIEAANRIGSAITIPEIPDRFKTLKILGRGATSIILEKDEDTSIVLTRDEMKTDWLKHSGMANFLGYFKGIGHSSSNFAFRELPIHAYQVPKLKQLSPANKKRVKQIIKEFETTVNLYHLNHTEKMNRLVELVDDYEAKFNKRHELEEFARFIINYGEEQFHFDMGQRQFMQDKNGNIVVNDPVVSREIMEIFSKPRRKEISRLSYDRGLVAADFPIGLEAAIENVLYHATSVHNVAAMLKEKRILLTMAEGSQSDQDHHKDHPYFFSTARSRDNRYIRGALDGAHFGVVLNIDKDWLKSQDKVKPVDYWGWGPENKETEDRLFTNKPELPIKNFRVFKSIHLLINKSFRSTDIHNSTFKSINRIILLCNKYKIPLKLYDEYKYFATQNPLRTIKVSDYIAYVKSKKIGPESTYSRGRSSSRTFTLGPFIELMNRPVGDAERLPKRTKELMSRVKQEYYHRELLTSIKNAIHNNKTSDREFLSKFLNEMKKFGAKSIKDLLDKLGKKWDNREA